MAVAIPDEGESYLLRGSQPGYDQDRLQLTALLEFLRPLQQSQMPHILRVHSDSEHIRMYLDQDILNSQHSLTENTNPIRERPNQDLWQELLRTTRSTRVIYQAPRQGRQDIGSKTERHNIKHTHQQEHQHQADTPAQPDPPDEQVQEKDLSPTTPSITHGAQPGTLPWQPIELPVPPLPREDPFLPISEQQLADYLHDHTLNLQQVLEASLPTLFTTKATPEDITITTPLRHNNGDPVIVHLIPQQDGSHIVTDAGGAAKCLRTSWSIPPPQHLLQDRAEGIRHNLKVHLVGGYLTTRAQDSIDSRAPSHVTRAVFRVAQAIIQLCCPADTGEISRALGD